MVTSVLPVYNRSKLEIERGEGAYLYTKDGRRYLDFVSGVAVNCLGHCSPLLVGALNEQSHKLWQISNYFKIPGMQEFADLLINNSFADTVFFCNSGTESIECSIKMMRKYHDATGNPDKFRIITFTGAFHGRTLAAIWASKRDPMMQEGFGPPVDGFDNVEFGNIEAVKAAITPETAAILIEPIQGDGGIRPAGAEFLNQLRQVADEHGLLLCFDEIQCGMGRSGKFFAYELYDVKPDIVASAKGIGGGFPLGACLATEKAAQGMTSGTHGSTYGGNPLAMAVGRAVVSEIIKPEFLAHVNKMGEILKKGLASLAAKYPAVIVDSRGLGLIQGLKLVPNNKEFTVKLEEAGLLVPNAAENVIRMLPPLIVTEAQINDALQAIENVCRSY